ncbi:MAG TPA: radical SAM protein [Chryseolinea sp.]
MLRQVAVKSVLNKTKRRDAWFLEDYTVNPFSGCAFNCLYCYIRGSKYGEHMEEKLSLKSNLLEVLEKQLKLRAKKGQYGIVVVSSATDPYLSVEEDSQVTRNLLELLLHYRFPVHIITKSNRVVRDFDILKRIDKESILPTDLQPLLSHAALITFSFSTLDDAVGKLFEPGAPSPTLRLQALQETLAAGFHSGVSLMPLIPYVTDTGENLHHMFSTFEATGAKYIFPATLTLFGEGPADSKTLVFRAIEKHYPHLSEKYRKLFAYGGQLPRWYRDAFSAKVKLLSEAHGLKNSILEQSGSAQD